MKIILDDAGIQANLYPFSTTRHVADIRVGILTIREKWNFFPGFELGSNQSEPGTQDPAVAVIKANIIPTPGSLKALLSSADSTRTGEMTRVLEFPWHIFQLNDWALRKDFEMITEARASAPISSTNRVVSAEQIFIEPGAMVEHSILNASTGPIYIGRNASVQEGCIIRGPFALCENAVLKTGTRIYGATTVGSFCTVGGEIKNAVLFGYSNKAHDGYLGDSVIGEWCNLGAGTSNSNVKNTAGMVKVWNNAIKDYVPVGLKCGVLMGDYSRSAINTSFNTGTVIGTCCNIITRDFPPKFVADFTWGEERYTFDKALRDIQNWKQLKGSNLSSNEEQVLRQLYTQS